MRTLGLCAIVAAVLSTAGAMPASGSSGSTTAEGEKGSQAGDAAAADQVDTETRTLMEAQAPLSAAAGRIQRVVDRGHDAGYAGIGLEDDHVVVWWKGRPPAAVRRAIRQVRRTVPVQVERTAHSRAELESAAQDVTDYMTDNPEEGYHSVEVAYDGSGLVVNVDPSSPGQSSDDELPSGMDVSPDVPVDVDEEAPIETTGRLDDYSPYWGAGRINNNDNSGFCTAGWPVRRNGTEYMLTAGHCGRPGGGWNNGNDTRFFGTGELEHVAHDLLLVRTDTASRIFDGGVGSGEFTRYVAGSAHAFPGEVLCTSGSVTGGLCGFTVSNNFTFSFVGQDAYGRLETYNDLVLADYCCGIGVRKGDSGGPVFGLSGSNAIVKGTITGFAGGGSQLIFQDFITAQRDFGITIAN